MAFRLIGAKPLYEPIMAYLENEFQWNLNQKKTTFIQENEIEIGLWKLTVMLSWPQSIKNDDAKTMQAGPYLNIKKKNLSVYGISIISIRR